MFQTSGGNNVDRAKVAPDVVKICDSQSEPEGSESLPVDVLKATTFFQVTDSGVIS